MAAVINVNDAIDGHPITAYQVGIQGPTPAVR